MALTRDLVLQIRAINRASKAIQSVKTQVDQLNMSVHALNTGTVSPQMAKQMEKSARAVSIFNKEIKNADGSIRKIRVAYDDHGRKIERLSKDYTTFNEKIDLSSKAMEGASKKAGLLGGFLKGLGNSARVSAEGFGRMIANNITWLAGFALISITIGSVIKLFGALIDRQNQFAKASRLIVASIEDQNKQANALTISYQAMVEQMARTGRSAEDVAEVQYQLLSAGLDVNEMLGAMQPTLALIDATSADVTSTTKIMAGIMNNYADTIKRTRDGTIVFVSDQQALEEQMLDNVTAFEKTQKVVDVVATAFRDHQVELNELRDGLRFAAATTKLANVNFDELVATLVTLEDRMVKAGRAGRSVRVMLSRLVKEPEKVRQAFGVAFDPTVADPLLTWLERVGDRFRKLPDAAEKLELAFTRFGIRGADAFAQLALNADVVRENLRVLREESSDVAEAMASVMRATPEVQFKRLGQSVVNLADAMGGQGLVRTLGDIAGGLGEVTDDIAGAIRWIVRFQKANEELDRQLGLNQKTRIGLILEWIDTILDVPEAYRFYRETLKLVLEDETKLINDVLAGNDAFKRKIEQLKKADDANQNLVASTDKLYKKNKELAEVFAATEGAKTIQEIMTGISSGMYEAGDASTELTRRLANISEQAKISELISDIAIFDNLIEGIYPSLEDLGKFTSEAIIPAQQGFVRAQKAVENYTKELIDAQYATTELKRETVELGTIGANQLLGLRDSLGIGISAGIGFLDTVNQLDPQIQKLRDEYAKLNAEGAEQEKLIDVYKQLTELQYKQSDALEKANKALAGAIPLIEQRISSTQKSIELERTVASEQAKIAGDVSKTIAIRAQASKREEQAINKTIEALKRQAQDRAKLVEISLKKQEISEEQYQDQIQKINKDTVDEILILQDRLASTYKDRTDLQIKNEEEAGKKLEDAIGQLKTYEQAITAIQNIIKDLDLATYAEEIRKPFEESLKAIEDMNEALKEMSNLLIDGKLNADKLADSLRNVAAQQAQIAAASQIGVQPPQAEQFGGIVRSSLVKVTAGEGFVFPSEVKKNLPTLQAINQGLSVPTNFPVHKFSGPSGIDNILTSLPTGSFVISKRGMEAMDRAVNYMKEKQHYQTGGLVSGATTTSPEPMKQPEATSKFELTLVVDGQPKTYPLVGSTSVVDEIRRTLERENLTKLG